MFDPFGDFATQGYLRNLRGDTDPRVVKASEHNFFEAICWPRQAVTKAIWAR